MDELEYWLKGESEQNVGDFLSEYFVQHLFVKTTRQGATVRVVGSALADSMVPPLSDANALPARNGRVGAIRHSLIAWGLGIRDSGSLSSVARERVQVLAVRGPITAREVGVGSAVPVGDPGLLMPALYTPSANIIFQGKRVCVPHFHDRRSDEELLKASACDVVLRTSVRNDIREVERFIDSLTSAAFVLCGSLHGAIFAAAYGVPYAYWNSGTVDLPLKWDDFAASVGAPSVFALGVADGETIYREQIKPVVRVPSLLPVLSRAPYIVRMDALLKVVQYDLGRRGSMPAGQHAHWGEIIDLFEGAAAHFQSIADEAGMEQEALHQQNRRLLANAAEERDEALALLKAEHQQVVDALTSMLNEHESTLTERESMILGLGATISDREATLGERAALIAAREHALADKESRITALEASQIELQHAVAAWQTAHDQVLNSASWRYTAGIRRTLDTAKSVMPKAKRVLRRAMTALPLKHKQQISTLKASRLFDAEWYLETYPDIRDIGVDPLEHYVMYGAAEGRMPRRLFDINYYLSQTGNARSAKANPLLHFLKKGRAAGLYYSPAYEALKKLDFSRREDPLVSIVVPTYGQADYTMHCLLSLANCRLEIPFEIIVAEDASGDADISKVGDIKGIDYRENKKNLGFLRSCNAAVESARGKYIFLLNNDTEVLTGAIEALVDTFKTWPEKVGLAGSRLLYPNGTLQEAGGIVWRDGSACNFGRNDDPSKHEYNYRRRADYISGAAIMLPKVLWDELGGFDEHYLPAYCEDSDLAFRVRQAGYEVIYVADSSVVHFEGISHGKDINNGIKAHQVENSRRLALRWKEVFSNEQSFHDDKSIRARDRARDKKVTLIIDHYVPEPDRDAGSRSMMTFIDQLIEMGHVVKFWPDNRHRSPGYTDALQRKGVEVMYGQGSEWFEGWISANGRDIDEVLLSRPHIAPPYIPLLRQHTSAVLAYYGHDLHHARMRLEAESLGDSEKLEAAEVMLKEEISVWRSVDIVLYPSEDEARAVRALLPEVRAQSISPYAFELSTGVSGSVKNRDGIIFVAGFAHSPNVDAAIWFCSQVFPLVQKKFPKMRLSLVGSNPTNQVKALAARNIEVTGYVSDAELKKRYGAARVAVAPLHYGAGVKLKVVEALQQGVPLVTTPVGAQGLEGVENVCAVTEDPREFADAVIQLLSMEDDEWLKRALAQQAYVDVNFSKERMRDDLQRAFSA